MIFTTIQEIAAKHLEIDLHEITPESSLKELGADSLALLDILMDIEEAFDVDIPEKKIGTKVGDIVDYIDQHAKSRKKIA